MASLIISTSSESAKSRDHNGLAILPRDVVVVEDLEQTGEDGRTSVGRMGSSGLGGRRGFLGRHGGRVGRRGSSRGWNRTRGCLDDGAAISEEQRRVASEVVRESSRRGRGLERGLGGFYTAKGQDRPAVGDARSTTPTSKL